MPSIMVDSTWKSLKENTIKFTLMKAQIKIFKTCALSTNVLRNKKKSFQKNF